MVNVGELLSALIRIRVFISHGASSFYVFYVVKIMSFVSRGYRSVKWGVLVKPYE